MSITKDRLKQILTPGKFYTKQSIYNLLDQEDDKENVALDAVGRVLQQLRKEGFISYDKDNKFWIVDMEKYQEYKEARHLETEKKKMLSEPEIYVIQTFQKVVDQMAKDFLDKEGDKIFEDIIEKFKEIGLDNLNIREIVIERINDLDFIEFEKIIFGLMNRVLKHIEIIGLILGSLIGVIQYVITIFL